jgi:CheY-like chemotaxis protein
MKKLLVVDDEKIVLTCCERSLAREGFDVTLAIDAVEGLRILKDKSFDVILTDLKMQSMDGLEFITQARRLSPDARIILITGYATDDVREAALEMGASYLPKPFSPVDLLNAIRGESDS